MKSIRKHKPAAHPLNQFLLDHLEAMRVKAISINRENQAFAFRKAIQSLTSYPLPLICQAQCLQLQGVGNKIGTMMSKLIYQRYQEYRVDSQPMDFPQDRSDSEFTIKSQTTLSQFKSKPKRNYSPQTGTGAWHIMKLLYKEGRSLKRSCLKSELKKETGKSSVQSLKSLVKHGLVAEQEDSSYSLTMEGRTYVGGSKVDMKVCKANIQKEPLHEVGAASKVILVIDNRQIKSQKDRSYFIQKLKDDFSLDVRLQNLAVGDFLWVAVDHNGQQWVAGHVLERKSTDDLATSLIDGRYRQQKHRLLSTNLSCYYLIEGPLQESKLSNAAISTSLSGFTVIRSEGLKDSCQTLAGMTRAIAAALTQDSWMSVCTFDHFQQKNSKSCITMNEQLGLMLRQIQGVGKEAALALSSHFSTWRELWDCLQDLSAEQRYCLIADTSKRRKKLPFTVIERIVKTVIGN